MAISYKTIGNGKEKVFVTHGWKLDHTCFSPLFPALDQQFFTYVFIDQRGYGLSRDLNGPYSIDQVAADIIDLSNTLGFDKFHVIGHSMGGKVIQRIMVDASERVISAIGITPVPACPIPLDDDEWALFSAAHDDRQKRQKIFRFSTGNRYTDSWYDYAVDKSMASCTAEAFAEYLRSWVYYDLVEDIKGNKTPIKLLVGEHDPHMTAELMADTYGHWLEKTEIEVIQGSGHYPMLETPLFLASKMEEFMKKY